jgi:hypothetical protein
VNILALDLATNCGWAHNRDEELNLGTWKLADHQEIKLWGRDRTTRRNDPRVIRLFDHLRTFQNWADVVVFEDVQFQTYTQQCQLWSSLRAAVWLAFPLPIVECVPVATLKKFATGSGMATKEGMIRSAINQEKRFTPVRGQPDIFWDSLVGVTHDDNAADAYHLFNWAKTNLGRRQTK